MWSFWWCICYAYTYVDLVVIYIVNRHIAYTAAMHSYPNAWGGSESSSVKHNRSIYLKYIWRNDQEVCSMWQGARYMYIYIYIYIYICIYIYIYVYIYKPYRLERAPGVYSTKSWDPWRLYETGAYLWLKQILTTIYFFNSFKTMVMKKMFCNTCKTASTFFGLLAHKIRN